MCQTEDVIKTCNNMLLIINIIYCREYDGQ